MQNDSVSESACFPCSALLETEIAGGVSGSFFSFSLIRGVVIAGDVPFPGLGVTYRLISHLCIQLSLVNALLSVTLVDKVFNPTCM